MNKQVLVFTVLTFAIFISCSKVNNKDMTIIKDCTGSYLRFNNKDYLICNKEVVESFNNGDEVEASFKKIEECEANWLVCNMIHQNEGWIKVTKIK